MKDVFKDLPNEMVRQILSYCSARDVASVRQVNKSLYADNDLRNIAFERFVQQGFWRWNIRKVDPRLKNIIEEFRANVKAETHEEMQANNILKDLLEWRKKMPNDFHTPINESYSLRHYEATFNFARGYCGFLNGKNTMIFRRLDSQLRWDWWKSLLIFIMANIAPVGFGVGCLAYEHTHRGEKLIPGLLFLAMILTVVYRDKFSNLGHHISCACCRRKEPQVSELEEIVVDTPKIEKKVK